MSLLFFPFATPQISYRFFLFCFDRRDFSSFPLMLLLSVCHHAIRFFLLLFVFRTKVGTLLCAAHPPML